MCANVKCVRLRLADNMPNFHTMLFVDLSALLSTSSVRTVQISRKSAIMPQVRLVVGTLQNTPIKQSELSTNNTSTPLHDESSVLSGCEAATRQSTSLRSDCDIKHSAFSRPIPPCPTTTDCALRYDIYTHIGQHSLNHMVQRLCTCALIS